MSDDDDPRNDVPAPATGDQSDEGPNSDPSDGSGDESDDDSSDDEDGGRTTAPRELRLAMHAADALRGSPGGCTGATGGQ